MSVLVDHQLNQALGAAPPLATNVPPNDFTGATSRIQAASLDLTIGDIFVPATDPDDPGGANAPRDKWCLYEGHTAVVRTFETLAVPATLMGIGFPPSSLSTQGILMTNPGEVDPGYAGPLHLTIINMGKQPFELRRHDRVMRLVFLRLADTPAADYAARHPGPAVPAVNNQLLQTLSPDFVDVEERAKKIASDAVQRATLYSTLLVAVLGFAGYIYMHYWDSYAKTDTRLTALEAGLSKLSTTVDVTKLNDRTDQLGDEVKRLQTATEALAHPAAPPPPPASPAVISPAAPPATQPPPPAIRAAAHPPAHKPVKK